MGERKGRALYLQTQGPRTDVCPVGGQSGSQKGGDHAVTVGEGEDLFLIKTSLVVFLGSCGRK